jgi:hypothetical protein
MPTYDRSICQFDEQMSIAKPGWGPMPRQSSEAVRRPSIRFVPVKAVQQESALERVSICRGHDRCPFCLFLKASGKELGRLGLRFLIHFGVVFER